MGRRSVCTGHNTIRHVICFSGHDSEIDIIIIMLQIYGASINTCKSLQTSIYRTQT